LHGADTCLHFSTPSLEEQLIRLSKKYGPDLKDAKIGQYNDTGKIFTASRFDKETGNTVNYAYFGSLAACDAF